MLVQMSCLPLHIILMFTYTAYHCILNRRHTALAKSNVPWTVRMYTQSLQQTARSTGIPQYVHTTGCFDLSFSWLGYQSITQHLHVVAGFAIDTATVKAVVATTVSNLCIVCVRLVQGKDLQAICKEFNKQARRTPDSLINGLKAWVCQLVITLVYALAEVCYLCCYHVTLSLQTRLQMERLEICCFLYQACICWL